MSSVLCVYYHPVTAFFFLFFFFIRVTRPTVTFTVDTLLMVKACMRLAV